MSSNPPSNGRPDARSDARRQSPRFATGRLLAGRYEMLDRIGEGGTAEVFRARDHRLDRIVAVKVLRPQYGQDPDARARFAVEARSAAALAASNIVPVYDFGAADDGSLFIVMRYIDGPSLRSVLADRGPLPAAEAIEIGRDVAYALAAAHEHGLIHRDVKPGNILFNAARTAHLTDFGIVKALTGAADLTRTGMAFGTAAYLSPEQATGGSIGPRTDLYALGVVLYEALAGQPPFSGEDPIAVSYRHAHDAPTPLSTLVPGIDADLERVVMQCLEKDPDRRPASAQDVAATLGSIGERLRSSSLGAPTLGALAGAAGATASNAATSGRMAQSDESEHESETVLMATVPPAATPPTWSAAVAPAAAYAPATRPAAYEPQTHAGVMAAPRPVRTSREDRREGAALGAAILLLALAVVAVVAVVLVLPGLLPSGNDGGVANASPTSRRSATPLSSAAVVLPPIATAPPTLPTIPPPLATIPPPLATVAPPLPTVAPPLPTVAPPLPTVAPPLPTVEPPLPTVEPPLPTVAPPPPTDPPTVPPTAPPTAPLTAPPPTPTPTPPPEITPTPPPPVGALSARIENEMFAGDFDQGGGVYHGRTASWVYGQGTPYHTMTATFALGHQGQVVGNASLELVGLDAENPIKQPIRIVLNGVTIYEGPNPLPDDTCCGPSGPGNWGSARFEFAGALVQQNNTLVISNLAASDCTECSKYVMVDYGVLNYLVQP